MNPVFHSLTTNSSKVANDNDTQNDSNKHSFVGIEEKICLIFLYCIIFLLAIVGNMLVIITLAINKRMRTVTNVFLMNLAISDMLLGVFCMPFTLAGALLREFVFGEAMCRMIPYFQAVSVSVSAWTLVVISVERYYAICHPLKSREWQTLSHANRIILIVWAGSLICMLPVAILSELQPVRHNKYKCRESWPSITAERLFNILLDVLLLMVPLCIMVVTYSLITATLWRAMQPQISVEQDNEDQTTVGSTNPSSRKVLRNILVRLNPNFSSSCVLATEHRVTRETDLRSVQTATNLDRSLSQKERVIKMLFVVVLEFFVCWSPIYALNTITLFDPVAVYQELGYYGISFFHLLAYTSSCCNPITYCFMNSKFRENFKTLFGCKKKKWETRTDGSLSVTFKSASKFRGRENRPFKHNGCETTQCI
ncbi:cholecystokinin receptor-like [Limulus polyphemus]|uniref:Gastrin/cholecystokinin type B receptor n=1 Tax=Limulus polyphemus TaxID=6850 RepID=A0ABM1S559_LIMPO|nr:cholecystokinin receptor-like [Limulus polyphemus]